MFVSMVPSAVKKCPSSLRFRTECSTEDIIFELIDIEELAVVLEVKNFCFLDLEFSIIT